VDNYLTLASNYGDMSYYWQGVDMTATARTNNNLTLQGGFTSGAGTRDQCEIWAALPENMTVLGVNQRVDACRIEEPWQGRCAGERHHAVAGQHPEHQ
jgi:hypothetical protein